MHEFITGVASMIILSMFVVQFACQANLFVELTACESLLNRYENSAKNDKSVELLVSDLNEIPNVSCKEGAADNGESEIEIRFENVAGSFGRMARSEDEDSGDTLVLRRVLSGDRETSEASDEEVEGENMEDVKDEEPDNNDGDNASDDASS